MASVLKVRLGESEGLDPGTAIVVEKKNLAPTGRVSVTITNEETSTSVELTGERARQVAMALISAFGSGGDAG